MSKNILLIIDPQNDFITGTLAVPEAQEKMIKLSKANLTNYDYICITLDSHPDNHSSFVENGGIWPKHCIISTDGWAIPKYLDASIWLFNLLENKQVYFYKKGVNSTVEEYSIFDNPIDGVTLKNLLSKEDNVDICGIAGDYCVLETLKALRNIVDNITVLTSYTASIDKGEKLMNYIQQHNINYK